MNTRDEVVVNRDRAAWCAPNSILGGEQVPTTCGVGRLDDYNLPAARGARARSFARCAFTLLCGSGLSGEWTASAHLAHDNKYNA